MALILLISAVLAVTLRNLFHCALFLIVALLSLAAIFFELGAPLLGVFQLVIYVGAVMVLIIFAIMLTARISDKALWASNRQVIPSLIAIAAFVGFTGFILFSARFSGAIGMKFDPIFDLSAQLLTNYLLPFEVISVVLLAALIGAITIARKD
jgi:NADH-quinone oxidoreductase subunit J